jgi:iron complex outermembrane recepter protein
MSVVGKGRRCGRVVASRSGLFTAPNSLALVLLTASPAAAQSAAEGNRNPTALPQVTIEAPKPRRPAVRRASPATQPALTAAPRVQQPASPPSTPSGTSTSGVGAAPTINLAAPASTASRLNLSRLQTPASAEIITAETIAERGQHSVVEAVTQNAAGFTASPAPGNGSLSFNTRGFTGNGTVMTLYDGTRLYVGAGTLTFPLDSWSVDRIEVLRGPASVMYGEGAIGGAINIIPKGPFPFARNEAEVSFDTNGTRRIAVDSGGPVNKDVTYRFAATGNLSDGWVDRDNTSNGALNAAVRVQSADNVAWTLSTDYADRKPSRYFGTPLINGRLDESLRFTNFNVGDSNIHYRDCWTRLKTEWDVNNDVSIHNVLYYLNSQRHWKDVETYSWNAKTGLVDRTSYIEIFHDQQQIGDRMDATVRGQILGFKNDFVTGFDVNRIDFTHTNNSPYGGLSSVNPYSVFDPGLFNRPNATVPAYNTVTNQYALFAEDRLLVTPQWSIVGGVRYDQPTIDRTDLLIAANSFEKSFSAVSWRAGTVYTPFPNFRSGDGRNPGPYRSWPTRLQVAVQRPSQLRFSGAAVKPAGPGCCRVAPLHPRNGHLDQRHRHRLAIFAAQRVLELAKETPDLAYAQAPGASWQARRPWMTQIRVSRDLRMSAERWSGQQDSNLRPGVPKTPALPGCAIPRHGPMGESTHSGR